MVKKLTAHQIAAMRNLPSTSDVPAAVWNRVLGLKDLGLVRFDFNIEAYVLTEAGKKALANLSVADLLAASLAITKEKK